MQFLFCCEFYYPSVGGVQEVMRQIAERMVRRGHQVTVATTRLDSPMVKEWKGVRIEHFAITGNNARGIMGEVDRYRDFVVNFPADAVMIKAAQQWTFDALFPVLDDIKGRKIFIPCGFSGFYEKLYTDYFKHLPEILRKFDELIFYAEKYRDIDFCRSQGLTNLHILPNGASESEFRTLNVMPDFYDRIGVREDSFILSTVGSLTGIKGHREIAEAFELMEVGTQHTTLILNGNHNSNVNLQTDTAAPSILTLLTTKMHRLLRLAQKGLKTLHQNGFSFTAKRAAGFLLRNTSISSTPSLEQQLISIQKRVNKSLFKKMVIIDLPRADVVNLFKASDLFVFASNIEYAPLVLFESAASATPFLTVNVGCAKEIAAMTQAGIVCEAPVDEQGYTRADPQKLAQAITEMMRDPIRLKQMGEAGRKNWLEKFTWDRIATQYETLLRGSANIYTTTLPAPTVSVILPVYNGAAYVLEAINSILAQTFRDFELIVIDDGSTDASADIVESVDDPRIILVRRPHSGLSLAPNYGFSIARGKYIARHDHDDLSMPTRFEKQVAFLEAHPDHAMVGTQSTIWVEDRPTSRGHRHSTDNATLQFEMLFNNYLVHSSIMIRRDIMLGFGGYTPDTSRYPPEDYELWSRIIRKHKIANLDEPLLIYREVATSVCRTTSFEGMLIKLCSENIAYAAGINLPNSDVQDIAALVHHAPNLASAEPNFSRMNAIIRKAAAQVDQTHPGGRALALAEILIYNLRWHPLLVYYDRLPSWMKRIIGGIRRRLVLAFPILHSFKNWYIQKLYRLTQKGRAA